MVTPCIRVTLRTEPIGHRRRVGLLVGDFESPQETSFNNGHPVFKKGRKGGGGGELGGGWKGRGGGSE